MSQNSDHFHKAQQEDSSEDESAWDSYGVEIQDWEWWFRKEKEFEGGKKEQKDSPSELSKDDPKEPKTVTSLKSSLLAIFTIVFCIALSAILTYAKYAGSNTPA